MDGCQLRNPAPVENGGPPPSSFQDTRGSQLWKADGKRKMIYSWKKPRTFHIYVSLQEGQLVIISPVLTGKTDAITSPLDHWLSLNSILQLVNSPLYRHFVCPT